MRAVWLTAAVRGMCGGHCHLPSLSPAAQGRENPQGAWGEAERDTGSEERVPRVPSSGPAARRCRPPLVLCSEAFLVSRALRVNLCHSAAGWATRAVCRSSAGQACVPGPAVWPVSCVFCQHCAAQVACISLSGPQCGSGPLSLLFWPGLGEAVDLLASSSRPLAHMSRSVESRCPGGSTGPDVGGYPAK